jgi:hypothetical protein
MKKYLTSLCALATCATALASSGSVVANGGFRDPAQGVATFAANINADALNKAFFVFASEGTHHGPDYPDAVFKSVNVTSYVSIDNTVTVMGSGLLYGEIPVSYMARFVDAGQRRGDIFELHCWVQRTNHVVHFLQRLTAGDIVVNPGK